MDTAPKYLAWAQLGWNIAANARAEFEWVHMGSYFLEPNNEHKYTGHDIFNLRGHYQLGDGWRMSARVHNLLDKNYADRADFAFGEYRYFTGLPRSLYLGVSKQF